jgi:hypothetical protein
MRPPARLLGLCLAASVALTACSGDGGGDDTQQTSGGGSEPSTAATPYLDVPDGV